MAYWALPALYTLTMTQLRKMGTKAALKEIAKRTAFLKRRANLATKTLKKEGLETSKFLKRRANLATLKRRNPFEVPRIDLTKLKTAHPLSNKGIAAGTTLGAATGYVAGRSDVELEEQYRKWKAAIERVDAAKDIEKRIMSRKTPFTKSAAQKFKEKYGK